MPQPRFRSTSYRKTQKRLPGGETVDRYTRRKPQLVKCAKCGVSLKGIPRVMPLKMKKLGISKKTVSRPFGGNLCSKCSRQAVKRATRV
ncbi:MAG: 50S ribosomal protein L34e [Candidatus Woesearchaeota archaeon]|jgi:large subunit ribosomal protein L34e|nr:50S ribosomal protein L34e [Candidatus Woesearchaeota archaeon]